MAHSARRRSRPVRGPRPRDVTSQTRTLPSPGTGWHSAIRCLDSVSKSVVRSRHPSDRVASRETVTPLVRVLEQFFDALVGPAGRDWRLRGAGLVAVLLLILFSALVGIIPLAYAGPPEPTWIPGIYDNADYDDVVWLVTDEVDARHTGTAARVQYAPIGFVSLAARGPVPSPIVSQHASRGPPIEVRAALVCLQP